MYSLTFDRTLHGGKERWTEDEGEKEGCPRPRQENAAVLSPFDR
jgi:hypothetical protein